MSNISMKISFCAQNLLICFENLYSQILKPLYNCRIVFRLFYCYLSIFKKEPPFKIESISSFKAIFCYPKRFKFQLSSKQTKNSDTTVYKRKQEREGFRSMIARSFIKSIESSQLNQINWIKPIESNQLNQINWIKFPFIKFPFIKNFLSD